MWDNCADVAGEQIYLAGTTSIKISCSNVDSTGIEGPGALNWLWSNSFLVPGFCDPRSCLDAPTIEGDYCLKDVSPCTWQNAPGVCKGMGARDAGCTQGIVTVRADGSGDYPTIRGNQLHQYSTYSHHPR